MSKNYSILVVAKDKAATELLQTLLGFMDETVYAISPEDWPSANAYIDDYIAVVLHDSLNDEEIQQIDNALQDHAEPLPILWYGERPLKEIPRHAQQSLLGTISTSPTHAVLHPLLERCRIAQEQRTSIQRNGTSSRPIDLFRSLVGKSTAIEDVRKNLAKVALTDSNVLILGESGTGKEVVARNIHYYSTRRHKPFVAVNCGAIPPELLESELFGHEKGAFTGAITTRQGRFEMAQGGTLFLDEIGDMPLPMQVKLLRVLQERCFERVGSNKSLQADVRIIAATHRTLEVEIAEGRFREDLFYRLNVFPIEMPTLRDRIEDLPILLDELSARLAGMKKISVRFLPRAEAALAQYAWPGNIRELANLVERMSILFPNGLIDVGDLPTKFTEGQDLNALSENGIRDEKTKDTAIYLERKPLTNELPLGSLPYLPEDGIDLKEYLVSTERKLIEKALEQCNGVVARAADFLKLRRTTLVEKMRKYGMGRLIEEFE